MSPTSDGAFIKLVSGKIEIGPPRIQGNEDVKTIISHQSIDVSTSSFPGKHQGPGWPRGGSQNAQLGGVLAEHEFLGLSIYWG